MRTILHSDLNNFYASVECARNPKLKEHFLVVCGDPRDRHGIVLAKNMKAKLMGIKTGMTLWQARKICPSLVAIIANFDEYLKYSRMVREIYEQYTDLIQPFGIDECWLDVTHSKIFGNGEEIANRLREEIKGKTGLTCSVGVSFNKIFAKLGSDLKKPDATTIISVDNFKEKIWNLPVEKLLYVGRATTKKLHKMCVNTIGDLAQANPKLVHFQLGKYGDMLQKFARGQDDSPVSKCGEASIIKSVGNSLTSRCDLTSQQQVDALFMMLAESVAHRMKKYGVGKANVVSVWCRTWDLEGKIRQQKLERAVDASKDIFAGAKKLFLKQFSLNEPIRALGISVSDFQTKFEQLSLFDDELRENALLQQDLTMQSIRKKYGYSSILRGGVLANANICNLDVEQSHVIHPVSFFKN